MSRQIPEPKHVTGFLDSRGMVHNSIEVAKNAEYGYMIQDIMMRYYENQRSCQRGPHYYIHHFLTKHKDLAEKVMENPDLMSWSTTP